MTRAHAVIGTAGHVDHGKTALVHALTGTDCDRLPEEKKRGITIDLGFARWSLPGLSASVVDVPGHERFVHTMVAGAAGLDLVMLVVAADDGVMPQTREHLAICEELGVTSGIVVVTKSDLADDDMLGLLSEEIVAATRGTFLEGAEIVRSSVREGRGLEEVTRAAARALGSLRPADEQGSPWLTIDRVFSKHGFGTIVTGTLVRGTIAIGDALELLPVPGPEGVERVIVRGMTVHGGAVERASATTRLALNLRGLERDRIRRGAVLTGPGAQRPTHAIDAELRLFDDAPALDRRTELVLHVGTAHTTVRARPLAPTSLEPGERGVVRLVGKSPFAVHGGQRFVLRRPELGGGRTVAGGVIVDPHPSLGRPRKSAPRAWLVPSTDLAERIAAMVGESPGGATPRALRERLPPEAALDAITAQLLAAGALLAVAAEGETRFFAPAHLARAQAAALEALAAFHREHPALSGATAAELEGRLPAPLRPLTARAIAALVAQGAASGGERVALPAHDARVLADRVAELYREAGLTMLTDDAVHERAGLALRTFRDLVAELARDGRIVRLASGLHAHESALEGLRARVRAHLETNETLSPGDFKTLTGLTRKNAILLLEWLDKRGVTRRLGDLRVLA